MYQDTVSKAKFSIYGHGRGWCFTQYDLLPLGHPAAVRQALARLQRAGFIRRIAWGLYEYPRKHPKLGLLPPDLQQVVKAIVRRDRVKVLPSGAYAANLLGLSQQVPGKIVHLTDGPSRRLRIGKTELIFKKTTPKNMATADTLAGIVIQALRHFGKDGVDADVIARLKKRLGPDEVASLRKHAHLAPAWVRQVIAQLTSKESVRG